jgi:hypothetical protein
MNSFGKGISLLTPENKLITDKNFSNILRINDIEISEDFNRIKPFMEFIEGIPVKMEQLELFTKNAYRMEAKIGEIEALEPHQKKEIALAHEKLTLENEFLAIRNKHASVELDGTEKSHFISLHLADNRRIVDKIFLNDFQLSKQKHMEQLTANDDTEIEFEK